MHILHSLFTNTIGGTERHVAELANAQRAAGHRVSILIRGNRCIDLKHDSFLHWLSPEVKVITLPRYWPFTSWPALPIRYQVWRLNPDIIHTHHGRDSRYLARHSRGCPVIATLHIRFRERDYGQHQGLICVSRWQQATIPPHHRKHAVVIPNWVKPYTDPTLPHRAPLRRSLGLPDDARVFGYAGRLSPEKGPDILMDSFLKAQLENAHLLIFGDGELAPQLHEMAKGHTNIHLMGYEPDIRPWYEAMDVFVLPSHEESFGLVLLEAMDAGLPVITTETLGARDLLPADKAKFTALGDTDSLTKALEEAAKGTRHRVTYPEKENYSLSKACNATLAFYERVLHTARSS